MKKGNGRAFWIVGLVAAAWWFFFRPRPAAFAPVTVDTSVAPAPPPEGIGERVAALQAQGMPAGSPVDMFGNPYQPPFGTA